MNDKKRRPDEPIPARVFVLIPTESSDAIVICRLRGKQVGVFKWDMLTNKIKVSQWMKGRIYEYFSDLSPDGKYFIYSMNHKGWGYTVISKAPWIKAISFWQNIGCWGGGIFLDDKHYVLQSDDLTRNHFEDKKLIHIYHDQVMKEENLLKKRDNFLKDGHYRMRMIENNWEIKEFRKKEITFLKQISHTHSIEKVYNPMTARDKGKGGHWESHRLIKNDTIIEKPDWEWCEYRYETIYYSEKGCLYELKDIEAKPKLIYDFNAESFVCKTAPY